MSTILKAILNFIYSVLGILKAQGDFLKRPPTK